MNFLSPPQRNAIEKVTQFLEKNPDASLTRAAKSVGVVPETYKAAVRKIKQAREERRVILRRAT